MLDCSLLSLIDNIFTVDVSAIILEGSKKLGVNFSANAVWSFTLRCVYEVKKGDKVGHMIVASKLATSATRLTIHPGPYWYKK